MALKVLDTDTLTLFLNGHDAVCRRIAAISNDEIATTIVTVEESLTGWYSRIRRAKKDVSLLRAYSSLQQVADILKFLRVLPFDGAALSIARGLRTSHRRIGTNDLRIAAIVLSHAAVLITRNAKDFEPISTLPLEDWSLPEVAPN